MLKRKIKEVEEMGVTYLVEKIDVENDQVITQNVISDCDSIVEAFRRFVPNSLVNMAESINLIYLKNDDQGRIIYPMSSQIHFRITDLTNQGQ